VELLPDVSRFSTGLFFNLHWQRVCNVNRRSINVERSFQMMNADVMKGRWNQVKGDIRSRWGKLTDDDMMQIQGDAEKLIGKLQERYGMKREQAERDLNEMLNQRRTA